MKLVISLLLAAASLPFARAAGDAVDPISYLRTGHGHGHGGGGLQVPSLDCTILCGGDAGCLINSVCLSLDELNLPSVANNIAGGKAVCARQGGAWCVDFCDVCKGNEGCKKQYCRGKVSSCCQGWRALV